MHRLIFRLLLLACLSGCQGMYDIAQSVNRQECRQYPDYEQYKRCMEATGTSYEQYQKERDKLLRTSPSGA